MISKFKKYNLQYFFLYLNNNIFLNCNILYSYYFFIYLRLIDL